MRLKSDKQSSNREGSPAGISSLATEFHNLIKY